MREIELVGIIDIMPNGTHKRVDMPIDPQPNEMILLLENGANGEIISFGGYLERFPDKKKA